MATTLLCPLYLYPMPGAWDPLVAAHLANPSVPVIAIVNPSNGPGTTVDPNYTGGINYLKANGIRCIGYVHTSQGTRPIADIVYDMTYWGALYPAVDGGFFFDEWANAAGFEAYYTQVVQIARAAGWLRPGALVVGNPGADTSSTYAPIADALVIWENPSLPSSAYLSGGWHSTQPRTKFGFIAYGQPVLDVAALARLTPYAAYVYVTSGSLPNPYNPFPSYLAQEVAALTSSGTTISTNVSVSARPH